ncbi:MAG: FeS-binding protein [Spirochaetae bacterium HGW-Spirochaetae-3]|jgi:uncharacterized protein (DUF362 family)/Pyruvate/2-oxoacid:ferredoxin oxidoreductase delta subunit|nr:MAG: FeS-binding protein [Spirochaetae bacterium HGW-Spirochaetae-3]
MEHSVAIVPCADYEVEPVRAAVADAVEKAGGLAVAGKTVLVKPNMLASADPERAVTTAPEMLRAVIRLLRAGGAARILVGDSPAFQSGDAVGAKSGLKTVALEEGVEWLDFGDSVEVSVPDGRLVKRFAIARAAAEADLIISLCRLKTHSFMYFTGAAKNLFGVIPGLQKSAFHMRFPGKREFGSMLADLTLAVGPVFSIMDAVVAMEGPGPRNGTPRKVGLVLAGANPFAVDWVASSIVGYDPMDVPYLREAAGSAVYGFDSAAIRTVGASPESVRVNDFKLVPIVDEGRAARKGPLGRLLGNLAAPRPFFSRKRCALCGACVKICPAGALEIVEGRGRKRYVAVDYEKCLRCYCCHEVCPEDAIRLLRRP